MTKDQKRFLTPEEDQIFVVSWTRAPNAVEAGKPLGLTEKQAISRAGYLRRNGVDLKRMQKGHRPKQVDVETLNKLVEQA